MSSIYRSMIIALIACVFGLSVSQAFAAEKKMFGGGEYDPALEQMTAYPCDEPYPDKNERL
jgi:hypothetical protein